MNVSIRALAFAFAAAILSLSSFAASSAMADTITINQQSVQILKATQVVCFGTNTACATTVPQNPVSANDTLNFKITFTNNGNGGTDCNPGNTDTIAHGLLLIGLSTGLCTDPFSPAFVTSIPSFVPKKVGGVKIGTYFVANGLGTIAAKITTQPTPPNTCSKYVLEFQATKLNLSSITHNPISLDIDNADDDVGCINIYNALIGQPF